MPCFLCDLLLFIEDVPGQVATGFSKKGLVSVLVGYFRAVRTIGGGGGLLKCLTRQSCGGQRPQRGGGGLQDRWYSCLRVYNPPVLAGHATQKTWHAPHPGLFWGKSPAEKNGVTDGKNH